MKVLVTGACGFIGSHLVDELVKQKHEVIATDLNTASKTFLNPKARFVPADLSSQNDVNNLLSNSDARYASIVYHVASIFDFFPPDDVMYKNNVIGTVNLLKAICCSREGSRHFVLWSSGAVYGNTTGLVSADENAPLKPKNAYERSKVEQEKVLKEFVIQNPEKLDAIILRPAGVLGPRSRYGAAKVLEFIANGQIQYFLGKKNLIAALVHVDDVVGAAIYLADRDDVDFFKIKRPGEIVPTFNIVDNSRYSYEELISHLAKCLEKTHGSKIWKFHMPIFALKAIGKWQEFLARKNNSTPKYAKDLAGFFEFPMTMNNFRLLSTGYQMKWPDTKKSIEDVVKWYLENKWI